MRYLGIFADLPLGPVLVKPALVCSVVLSIYTQEQQRQPQAVDHFLASNRLPRDSHRQSLTLALTRGPRITQPVARFKKHHNRIHLASQGAYPKEDLGRLC